MESLPHQLLACGSREPPGWAESVQALSECESEAAGGKLRRQTFPYPEHKLFHCGPEVSQELSMLLSKISPVKLGLLVR